MTHTYNYLVRAHRPDGTHLDMAIGEGGLASAQAQAKFSVTDYGHEFERAEICWRIGDTDRFTVVDQYFSHEFEGK